MLNHIQSEYAEYIVAKKPIRINEALYDADRCRRKGEGMIYYYARRRTRFNKLQAEGEAIPDDIKGCLLYRVSNFPDKARKLIEIWTDGDYEWEDVKKNQRRLERPILDN